jgi:hypothetical protein
MTRRMGLAACMWLTGTGTPLVQLLARTALMAGALVLEAMAETRVAQQRDGRSGAWQLATAALRAVEQCAMRLPRIAMGAIDRWMRAIGDGGK